MARAPLTTASIAILNNRLFYYASTGKAGDSRGVTVCQRIFLFLFFFWWNNGRKVGRWFIFELAVSGVEGGFRFLVNFGMAGFAGSPVGLRLWAIREKKSWEVDRRSW